MEIAEIYTQGRGVSFFFFYVKTKKARLWFLLRQTVITAVKFEMAVFEPRIEAGDAKIHQSFEMTTDSCN